MPYRARRGNVVLVSFGWLGQRFIGGRSVVARFLFMLENRSGGQQSFESGSIEGGAVAHAEIASINKCSSSKIGHDGIRFTVPRENVLVRYRPPRSSGAYPQMIQLLLPASILMNPNLANELRIGSSVAPGALPSCFVDGEYKAKFRVSALSPFLQHMHGVWQQC